MNKIIALNQNTEVLGEFIDQPTSQKLNTISAYLTEFVSNILIERTFFQNTDIPQITLLRLVNNLIQTLNPKNKVKVDFFKEWKIIYKELLDIKLTPEEEKYDKSSKELDILGEFLNGINYSTSAIIGQNLYSSVTSAVKQGLSNHLPAIIGYSGAILIGPKLIDYAIDYILSYSELTPHQKNMVIPWLKMAGHLVLDFLPKVHATDKGVHYQFPSIVEHSKTFTNHQTTTTTLGNTITIEREGQLDTPEGQFDAEHAMTFKLHSVNTITEEKIRMHIINHEGKKIPVEFYTIQGESGPEIQVKSVDKLLCSTIEGNW